MTREELTNSDTYKLTEAAIKYWRDNGEKDGLVDAFEAGALYQSAIGKTIDTDKFVGNERSVSAVSDLETPSKKIVLKIAKDDGIKWATNNSVDFDFVNKAVIAAMENAKECDHDEKRNPAFEQTMIFGFLAGVIEHVC